MKKLGFGLLRPPLLDPNDPGSIDIAKLSEMADAFLKKGFTYFDTAYLYCAYECEKAVKKVLTDRYPRESFQLATKMPTPKFWHSEEEREQIFRSELERCGVEYFDYYLLHNVNSQYYNQMERFHCFEWLLGKKKLGFARNVGFSFHDGPELLDQILTLHPEVDFVQLQLNYLDWDSVGIQSRKCYEVAEKHHKPVIVMEPVKGGTLAQVPAEAENLFREYAPDRSIASWAVRFAASQSNVMMVLSGMSTLEQLEDNTSYMQEFVPLNEEEYAIIQKAAEGINASIAIPCTGCAYCVEGCPQKIRIPQYFSLYNADKQVVQRNFWSPQAQLYRNLTQTFGKADDCIACGQCERACPQHLPIISYLKDVAGYFAE